MGYYAIQTNWLDDGQQFFLRTLPDPPYHTELRLKDAHALTSPPDLEYLLWTTENPRPINATIVKSNVDSIRNSEFNASRPTKILVHGFTGYPTEEWIFNITEALLNQGDYNIFAVDYEYYVEGPYYYQAVINSHHVGEAVGRFIDFLILNFGAKLEDFHPIGFSLGGQTVGRCVQLSSTVGLTVL